jgi:hypothetical protein
MSPSFWRALFITVDHDTIPHGSRAGREGWSQNKKSPSRSMERDGQTIKDRDGLENPDSRSEDDDQQNEKYENECSRTNAAARKPPPYPSTG